MSMFTFNPEQILTPVLAGDIQTLDRGGSGGTTRSTGMAFDDWQDIQDLRDDGTAPSRDDLQAQFVFQLNKEQQRPAILNAESVTPQLEGSDDQPDALATLNLISFHLGTQERLEKDARATIRINFGKDPGSAHRMIETAYWAIAAGMATHETETPPTGRASHGRGFGKTV